MIKASPIPSPKPDAGGHRPPSDPTKYVPEDTLLTATEERHSGTGSRDRASLVASAHERTAVPMGSPNPRSATRDNPARRSTSLTSVTSKG
jgi:hypothetical protein